MYEETVQCLQTHMCAHNSNYMYMHTPYNKNTPHTHHAHTHHAHTHHAHTPCTHTPCTHTPCTHTPCTHTHQHTHHTHPDNVMYTCMVIQHYMLCLMYVSHTHMYTCAHVHHTHVLYTYTLHLCTHTCIHTHTTHTYTHTTHTTYTTHTHTHAIAELRDYDPEEHPQGYISQIKMFPNQTKDLEGRIAELHLGLQSRAATEMDVLFLSHARRLDFYGVELFPCLDPGGTHVALGISSSGITVFQNMLIVKVHLW